MNEMPALWDDVEYETDGKQLRGVVVSRDWDKDNFTIKTLDGTPHVIAVADTWRVVARAETEVDSAGADVTRTRP